MAVDRSKGFGCSWFHLSRHSWFCQQVSDRKVSNVVHLSFTLHLDGKYDCMFSLAAVIFDGIKA